MILAAATLVLVATAAAEDWDVKRLQLKALATTAASNVLDGATDNGGADPGET